MRATKVAIAGALRADPAVAALVPVGQIYSVERAVVPTLPSIEVIAVTSERVGDGPMVRHSLSIEVTVSHQGEDEADALLDAIVAVVRGRLATSEDSTRPIPLASGERALVALHGTKWSISAQSTSSVVRGAAITLAVEAAE